MKGDAYEYQIQTAAPAPPAGAPAEPVRLRGDHRQQIDLEDGEYAIEVELVGGSGKAGVNSPTLMTVKDAQAYATLIWSSSNYDYMIVDGTKYLPTTLEPGSTFEIPIAGLDEEIAVTGDTTAMSKPHEIDYVLVFDSATLQEAP